MPTTTVSTTLPEKLRLGRTSMACPAYLKPKNTIAKIKKNNNMRYFI